MNRFMSCVTDHVDHKVIYNQEKGLVYVDVRNKTVEKSIPDTSEETWKFLLSW